MRAQETRCRYRGHLIVCRTFGTRMVVSVYHPTSYSPYYRTSTTNLHKALAYAQNAVAYDLDGAGTWPGGLPLTVNPVLPQTKARHDRRAKRVETRLAARRQLLRSPQVQDYLADKQEDWN